MRNGLSYYSRVNHGVGLRSRRHCILTLGGAEVGCPSYLWSSGMLCSGVIISIKLRLSVLGADPTGNGWKRVGTNP